MMILVCLPDNTPSILPTTIVSFWKRNTICLVKHGKIIQQGYLQPYLRGIKDYFMSDASKIVVTQQFNNLHILFPFTPSI